MEPPGGRIDEVLVKRCKAKDREAFAELVGRYKNRVYWLVERLAGDQDAEDLTQDVFLRAYEALPRFRGDSKFSTWLYKIARNLCISELRKRGRRGERVEFAEEEIAQRLLPRSCADLEERIEREDLSHYVRAVIGRLPESYRAVLTLFYINDARYEEIAEIMGLPIGTVKTQIHRARLRMRALLLKEEGFAAAFGGRDGRPVDKGESR